LNDIQMKSKRDHPQMTSHIFGPSSHLSFFKIILTQNVQSSQFDQKWLPGQILSCLDLN